MPPKRKRKQPTQSQRQSQKVIVNIGTKSKPRKKSGRGGLPPPSHMHNLAPTFVTSPQIDYTPLLMAITQQTRSLQPEAIRNPVTPLSSVMATAEQMAGEAAQRRAVPIVVRERTKDKPFTDPFGFPEPVVKSVETIKQEFEYLKQQKEAEIRRQVQQELLNKTQQRRPGPTADNFQPPPSLADERLAQQVQTSDDIVDKEAFVTKVSAQREAQEAIRLVEQALNPLKSAEPFERGIGAGGGILTAEARFKRGPIPKNIQKAVQLGPQVLTAEEPPPPPKKKKGAKQPGRPSDAQKLAEKTTREVAEGKQTQLGFVKQGL